MAARALALAAFSGPAGGGLCDVNETDDWDVLDAELDVGAGAPTAAAAASTVALGAAAAGRARAGTPTRGPSSPAARSGLGGAGPAQGADARREARAMDVSAAHAGALAVGGEAWPLRGDSAAGAPSVGAGALEV